MPHSPDFAVSESLVTRYLAHVRVGKRLATRSVDIYAHALAQLTKLCADQGLDLLQVEHVHIRRWMAAAHSRGQSAKTLALQLSSWRGFFKWLIEQELLQHNPCQGLKAPKVAKPLPKALGVDAAVALANFSRMKKNREAGTGTGVDAADGDVQLAAWIEHRDALIVELLYGCGLRVSELVGLDAQASAEASQEGRGWIDRDSGEVHVFGKGSKRRMVPLGEQAAQALAKYGFARESWLAGLCPHVPPQAALLINTRGQRLTRHNVWALLKARSLAAGLAQSVHPHMLRHSFASHVLQSSHDLRAVQDLLGHRSIASTQVYTRLDFQHLADIYDQTHPRAKKNISDV